MECGSLNYDWVNVLKSAWLNPATFWGVPVQARGVMYASPFVSFTRLYLTKESSVGMDCAFFGELVGCLMIG